MSLPASKAGVAVGIDFDSFYNLKRDVERLHEMISQHVALEHLPTEHGHEALVNSLAEARTDVSSEIRNAVQGHEEHNHEAVPDADN